MQESYTGHSRIKKLTPQQIKKMKENMRKVPKIQEKSNAFHLSEAVSAEKLLENYINSERKTSSNSQTPQKKLSIREKIKNYFFN